MPSRDPIPDGFALRAPTVDDAEAIAELVNEVNVAGAGFPWTTTEETRDMLTSPERAAPSPDVLLIDEDGSVAGYLESWTSDPAEPFRPRRTPGRPGDPQTLRDRLRLETARAMLAEARGHPEAAEAYARVAERLRAYGDPFEEAMALLGHARMTGDETSRMHARRLLDRLGVAPPID